MYLSLTQACRDNIGIKLGDTVSDEYSRRIIYCS